MVAAGAEGPALAAEVPQSGEEHAGVLRVDRDGAAARGEVRTREDQVPAPAAVGRLVEPAIGTVAPELARRAGIDHVGVARIDGDLRDPLGLLQPHAGPALAAIDRLVDAVSDGNGIARPGLAGPDPEDLGVLGIDLYRSDRLDRLLVEDGLERRAAVLALPHPAARRGNVEQGLAVHLATRDRRDAAAHGRRTDVARIEPGDDAGIDHRALRHPFERRRPRDERRRLLRRRDRARSRSRREPEQLVVRLDVALDALEREPLRFRSTLAAGLDRGGDPDAVDLRVRAEVRLGDALRTPDPALADAPDLQEVVGIEIDVLDVAFLERDAQLVRRRSVHVLGAEIADLVALLAPPDQGSLEVRVLRQSSGLVRGGAERVLAALERIDAPTLLAVVRVDRGQALQRDLRPDPVRTLPHLGELRRDGEVLSAADERLAADFQILQGSEPLRSAPGLGVSGDDFIHGEGAHGSGQCGSDEERRVHFASGKGAHLTPHDGLHFKGVDSAAPDRRAPWTD